VSPTRDLGARILISAGWKALFEAQRRHELAASGISARVRHPQYDGFVLIMFGFLLQWPTLLTLVMFPALVFMYARLARSEEHEAMARFGPAYERYMHEVPAFIPTLTGHGFTRQPK
jgi:protein-S-isoprenylcysteine O-methyltransferase Ste14